MNFNPKSRDELAKENLLPVGVYDFEVLSAEDAVSKVKPDGSGGNEMIKLKLCIFRPDGSQAHLLDYLVSTIEYKLAAFCDAVGKSDAYDAGQIQTEDLQGLCGKCKLGIEEAKGDYAAKNKVASYIPRKPGEEGARPKPPQSAEDKAAADEQMPF